MNTYQNLRPKSISLEDVTEYLREIIEFTEQESQRVYAYAEEELKKEEADPQKKRSWTERHLGEGIKMEDSLHFVSIHKGHGKSPTAITIVDRSAEKIEHGICALKWDDQKNCTKAMWHMLPFQLEEKPEPVLPTIELREDGYYQILLQPQIRLLDTEDRFPSRILYDYENNKILKVHYTIFEAICEAASEEDREILLRDWLPLKAWLPL